MALLNMVNDEFKPFIVGDTIDENSDTHYVLFRFPNKLGALMSEFGYSHGVELLKVVFSENPKQCTGEGAFYGELKTEAINNLLLEIKRQG